MEFWLSQRIWQSELFSQETYNSQNFRNETLKSPLLENLSVSLLPHFKWKSQMINPVSTGLYLVVGLGGLFHPPSIKFDPDILEYWNLEGWDPILFSTKYANLGNNDKKWRHNDVIMVLLGVLY